MRIGEALGVLAGRVTDSHLVITSLGFTSTRWWQLTRSEACFHWRSGMGMVPSMGIGLSLMLPQARVWAINSDGALCMNLGTLLTEANLQPQNLVHFVMSNRCYQAAGGQPLANTGTDYVAMARAAGCKRAFAFHDLEQWKAGVDGVVAPGGYAFVVLEVEAERHPPDMETKYEGPELKYRFARHIERRFGVRIFGPTGY